MCHYWKTDGASVLFVHIFWFVGIEYPLVRISTWEYADEGEDPEDECDETDGEHDHDGLAKETLWHPDGLLQVVGTLNHDLGRGREQQL